MALASQTIRAADRNRYMTNSRRRRRPGSRLLAIIFLLVVVGAVWWLIRIYGAVDDPGAGAPETALRNEARAQEPSTDPYQSASDSKSLPSHTTLLTPEPVVSPPAGVVEQPTVSRDEPHDAVETAVDAAIDESVPNARVSESEAKEPPVSDASSTASAVLAQAIALMTTDPIAARRDLTRTLDGSSLSTAERYRAYTAVNEVNQPLFFKSGLVQGDTVFATHRVESGETPVSIVRTLSANCEGDLLLRVNEIADARRIRIGQVLKVPKGVFHGEVRKGEYRLNLFHGEGAERVMVASFPVGLGEFNTTPTGIFKVRPRSKLKNPQWRNPRTGEFFAADNSKNPIGERWIGLEGIEPHNQDFAGYGIHGTIEPDSIGQMRSMGCIRMREGDVEIVYEMLTAPNSAIVIAP